MCKWGTDEVIEVTMQPNLGYPQPWEVFLLVLKERFFNKRTFSTCLKRYREWKKKCKIDKCIAPIVKVLDENRVRMLASCCGHDKEDHGLILLLDKTELIIPIKFTSNVEVI